MGRRPLFALFFALLYSCSLVAFAQQETATITGEVKDASGASIPKAQVTITNTETGISSKTETNDNGVYTIPSLKPGLYTHLRAHETPEHLVCRLLLEKK